MKDEKSSNGSSEEDEDFCLNFEECDEEAFNAWVDSLQNRREWRSEGQLIYFSLTKYEGIPLSVKSFLIQYSIWWVSCSRKFGIW